MAYFWLILAMLIIFTQKHKFQIAFIGILPSSTDSCPLNQMPFINEIDYKTQVFLHKYIIFTIFHTNKPLLMAKDSHFVFYRNIC